MKIIYNPPFPLYTANEGVFPFGDGDVEQHNPTPVSSIQTEIMRRIRNRNASSPDVQYLRDTIATSELDNIEQGKLINFLNQEIDRHNIAEGGAQANPVNIGISITAGILLAVLFFVSRKEAASSRNLGFCG